MVWGDNYFSAGVWIDTPTRSGFVAIASLGKGKCYYMTSDLHNDFRQFELHIFDPADFSAVKNGSMPPWKIQPAAMAEKVFDGIGEASFLGVPGLRSISGLTYDDTTQRLYAIGCGSNGIPNSACRLYVFGVRP